MLLCGKSWIGIALRQAVEHDQKAAFDKPNGYELHLLRNQDHLRPELALFNILGGQVRWLAGVNQIAVGFGDDVHCHHENSISDLRNGEYMYAF